MYTQTRNAHQTALALSRMKAFKYGKRLELTDEQFKTVAKTSKAFDDYLLKTQGNISTRLTKMHKLRNDEVSTRRGDDRLYKTDLYTRLSLSVQIIFVCISSSGFSRLILRSNISII